MSFWSRRNFLVASAAAAALGPRVVRAATGSHPEFLLVCIADGGWDVTFTFDPKPDNPLVDGPDVDHPNTESIRTFHENQVIAVNDTHRLAVTNFFELWGDRAAVLNGLTTGSIVHEPCRVRLLTGSTKATNPDWATIFGQQMGTAEPIGAVDFSGLSYPGHLAASTARVGARSQLKALVDPSATYPAPPDVGYELPLFSTSTDERAAVRAVLEERAERFRDVRGVGSANGARIDDLLRSMDRASRLREDGPSLMGGLELSLAPDFEAQAGLAVELLDKGLCRALTLKYDKDWDTHSGNAQQHSYYQGFFRGLNSMLADLDARGLLDRTLVVVLSEMGRTPKLNAGKGKDHWAHTSELVIGAGVRGGLTLGATDERVESMKIDLATGEALGAGHDESAPGEKLRYDHFAAGILTHMGVDPEPWYPGVTAYTAWSDVL